MADDAITVPLTEEIAAFEKARENLEKTYPSKFVLFKGSDLIGARDTLDAAPQQAVVRSAVDRTSLGKSACLSRPFPLRFSFVSSRTPDADR